MFPPPILISDYFRDNPQNQFPKTIFQLHLIADLGTEIQSGGEMTEETFASYNLGRKLRTWSRWIHTGEVGGFFGQFIAGLVSLGGAFLVWTGFALAWCRFFQRKTEVANS